MEPGSWSRSLVRGILSVTLITLIGGGAEQSIGVLMKPLSLGDSALRRLLQRSLDSEPYVGRRSCHADASTNQLFQFTFVRKTRAARAAAADMVVSGAPFAPP